MATKKYCYLPVHYTTKRYNYYYLISFILSPCYAIICDLCVQLVSLHYSISVLCEFQLFYSSPVSEWPVFVRLVNGAYLVQLYIFTVRFRINYRQLMSTTSVPIILVEIILLLLLLFSNRGDSRMRATVQRGCRVASSCVCEFHLIFSKLKVIRTQYFIIIISFIVCAKRAIIFIFINYLIMFVEPERLILLHIFILLDQKGDFIVFVIICLYFWDTDLLTCNIKPEVILPLFTSSSRLPVPYEYARIHTSVITTHYKHSLVLLGVRRSHPLPVGLPSHPTNNVVSRYTL